MMKKILAVLLLGCLFCLALAGCGKTDLEKSQKYMDDHPLEEKKLYSVSFCLVSDDAIDAATMKTVSENFNRYTEANYNIHVEFTNVTAAEYAAWLEEKFTAVEAARDAAVSPSAGNPDGGEEATAVPVSATSGTGSLGADIRDVYPEIAEDQFDIVYIANYGMLASLVRAGRLRDLTAELTSTDYRLIKKQMTEKFFDASKLAGKIYAVPNCRVLADYKYLRVNVAKAQYYNYSFRGDFSDYRSTERLRDAITHEGSDPADFVQRDRIGDYNHRFTLAEDGAWWVCASANEQLPSIMQSDLMNGMLAVTSYAYIDNNGTKYTEDDDYCPAVRILYAVNTVSTLQSTLRYGAYTTSTVDAEGTRTTVVTPQAGYNVDAKYTGNSFVLYPTQQEYENNVQYGNRTQNNETRITTDIYTISASSAVEGCTATVSSEFGKTGETVTFTAVPADGYVFKQWVVILADEDEEEQTEEVKSTKAVYNYVVASGDIELIAQFATAEK